jgi:uncharacterized protein
MTATETTAVNIAVDANRTVSGILQVPSDATGGVILAHGAGAGMTHPFMATVADGLAARAIATLRYQFPYMETGSKRPDRPALAQATVRAAAEAIAGLLPGLPILAGGKSFGGRMTSQAQADAPLRGVRGLFFFGFPLHAAGKPSVERAAHLARIRIPMLFLQGTRDALAELPLLVPAIERLGPSATLSLVDQADHSFKVPARSGRSSEAALATALDELAAWAAPLLVGSSRKPRHR